MTRILSLIALLIGLSAPAQAFVVGSPSFPSGWPSDKIQGPADGVTRDSIAE